MILYQSQAGSKTQVLGYLEKQRENIPEKPGKPAKAGKKSSKAKAEPVEEVEESEPAPPPKRVMKRPKTAPAKVSLYACLYVHLYACLYVCS